MELKQSGRATTLVNERTLTLYNTLWALYLLKPLFKLKVKTRILVFSRKIIKHYAISGLIFKAPESAESIHMPKNEKE